MKRCGKRRLNKRGGMPLCHPILLADINVNRHALLKRIEKINDEQVLKLAYMFAHYRQRLGRKGGVGCG